MSEQSNSARNIIIIAILVVLVGSIGAWYFLKYKPDQEAMEKARLEQIAKAEAEQKAKELAVQNKIQYDALIIEADASFELEEWLAAQSAYSKASSLFPDEQYPKDQLALVNAKLEELAELEAKREAGIIETVSSTTGRFYAIISSSVDDDLAMDYARKLSLEGVSVKVVEHHGNRLPFFGVSLGDYDTWDQATAATESFSEYGEGIWVLKY